MKKKRASVSRLKKIEDRRNKQQALLFILLSIGFLALVIFIGSKFFVKAAVFLGDVKSSGQGIDQEDTVPPIPPRLFSEVEATNSAKIKLFGYSEPGSVVKVVKNGKEDVEGLTEDDGTFEVQNIELKKGKNSIKVYAIDASANESQPSKSLVILFDDEAPELSITNPEDGAKYYDNEREIIVAGETEEDAHVKVNGYVVTVDTEGNFVKRLQLNEGKNEIKVRVYDEAGNEVEKMVSVSYSK